MSMPFYAREFEFTQPDGTTLAVRGWGDQNEAVFETLDGYTVVENPVTGFYEYAAPGPDSDDLVPTGAPAGAVSPAAIGLARNLRISPAAADAKAAMSASLPRGKSRWEERRAESREARLSEVLSGGILAAPPQRTTVGTYVGLCLLIDFPDVPGTITQAEVEAFCNQAGYNGFGNHGSVRDYFLDVSGNRLDYTNIVTPYYRAKKKRAYYTNEKIKQPIRALELIKEALAYWMSNGFDFTGLTSDSADYIYAVNVFYAGRRVNNWAKGLWPHAFHLQTPYAVAPGKNVYDYQITEIGSELTLGTFCHENGHMICDFPDLYDYGYESRGVGVYCLMCAGGGPDPKNPAHVGAYLKYRAGWASSVSTAAASMNVALTAGANEFVIVPRNKTEYFILESRLNVKRDSVLPSGGLAIWHVDELGNNDYEHRTPSKHYECSLVQADNAFHLELGSNDGDAGDLFAAPHSLEFTEKTTPNNNWWDGSPSNFQITAVSPPGTQMKFAIKI